MRTVKTVLVGVDLHQGDRLAAGEINEASAAGVSQAIQLAQKAGAKLDFVTVLQISAEAAARIAEDHAHLLRSVADVALEQLKKLQSQAESAGVAATCEVLYGSPADAMMERSTAIKADLIIVGTRNRSESTRFLFGSTSQKLIRSSPTPVWIVKPGNVREILEIAVATDLSPYSKEALEEAIALARILSARLYVLHAVNDPSLRYLESVGVAESSLSEYQNKERNVAHEKLKEQIASTDYRAVQHGVQLQLLDGEPEVVIPGFLEEKEVDLLVMGTKGRSGLPGLVIGNTAERLLPAVMCSLLTIKPAV